MPEGDHKSLTTRQRIVLAFMGFSLLALAALLLLSPPSVEAVAPSGSGQATVEVDANYETVAIVTGVAGCLLALLGLLNLRPIGFRFAGNQVDFNRAEAEVIDRRKGDAEELAKQAASDLESDRVSIPDAPITYWLGSQKPFQFDPGVCT